MREPSTPKPDFACEPCETRRSFDGASGATAQGAPAAFNDTPTPGDGLPSATELEQTLQRLVRRIAMLIQAEMCVFLLHDRERNQLVARPPALGLTPEQIKDMRLPPDRGLSGAVFTSGQPMVVQDASKSTVIDPIWAQRLDVHNVISHPLVMERRDEQERVTSRTVVGVLHVINKRMGQAFTDEDIRLLSVMAKQVTAVIANAQLYLRLSEEKEQLQATLQSLLAGVVMMESTGHISLINSAARHMFGLDEYAGIGRLYWEVIPQTAIVDMIRQALEHGADGQTEVEIALPGQGSSRIFQGQTAFVRGEAGGTSHVLGVVAIFNDITEIRNVERMKTAFVSTVSHELRTPLTSIKGFISTLLQDKEGFYDNDTRTEFYEIIDSECDRLQRLIEDLLNVSRIESGRALQMNWAFFDPVPVIEKVLQAQRSYTDKHEMKVVAHGEIPSVLGDADKFDQIMTNLVSNAIKYSPSGGAVTVDVKSEGDTLTVAVKDQGIGIPEDKLSRVFEKFERVDDRDTRQAGGTGIGLFLVKHLVERHDGEVWVESEPGQGSTFIFRVPLHPPQAEEDMSKLKEAPNTRLNLTPGPKSSNAMPH
jgi:two-component system phosphate regulon sensor histidine kinase PhoR